MDEKLKAHWGDVEERTYIKQYRGRGDTFEELKEKW
jgi:hypothetical protein